MNTESVLLPDENLFATFAQSWTVFADSMIEAGEMWQLPLVMALDWWAEAIDAGWSRLLPESEPDVPDHHSELIVPDKLKQGGEHALFA